MGEWMQRVAGHPSEDPGLRDEIPATSTALNDKTTKPTVGQTWRVRDPDPWGVGRDGAEMVLHAVNSAGVGYRFTTGQYGVMTLAEFLARCLRVAS